LDIEVLRCHASLELAGAIIPHGQGAGAELLTVAVDEELVLIFLILGQIGPAELAPIEGETSFKLAVVQRLRFALVFAPIDARLIVGSALAVADLPRHPLTKLAAVIG